VCVIENAGIAQSISRSFELAGRRFLPWIPIALATFLLGLPFTGMAAAVDDPTGRAWFLESLSVPAWAFDWTIRDFPLLRRRGGDPRRRRHGVVLRLPRAPGRRGSRGADRARRRLVAHGDGLVSALQHPVASREEVGRRLETIFAREEFGERRSWLGEQWAKLLDTLGDWIGDLFGIVDPETSVNIVKALIWITCAAILAWIVYRVVRWARSRESGSADRGSAPGQDLRAASVAALRREARAASLRGDSLAALRLLFRALVLGLSERGELEYRDAWTNRELYERGAPRRDVAPLLAGLVPRLDAQSFGREPAGPEDVERLSSLCDRLLGSASA
jgi:hypothetical protein